MDQRQKKAFYNIKWAANDLLGGLENTLLDYPEDSDAEWIGFGGYVDDEENNNDKKDV